jgi:hypothetical protein
VGRSQSHHGREADYDSQWKQSQEMADDRTNTSNSRADSIAHKKSEQSQLFSNELQED